MLSMLVDGKQSSDNCSIALVPLYLKINNIHYLNTLRPRQNGCHFPDDIFKCIFMNENVWIWIKISLKFVPSGSINNNPALFQITAWHRPSGKPLSEPMVVRLLMHICVTRPQWVNGFIARTAWHWPHDINMRPKSANSGNEPVLSQFRPFVGL